MNVNPNAKRVLIFGDSITWGRVPGFFERHDASTRWTCVVQSKLGDEFEIIEEGLRGRTMHGSNPMFRDRDGSTQYGPTLACHVPLDLVVIFLGTNDCATCEPEQIAHGIARYVAMTKRRCEELQADVPRIAIVSPPLIDDSQMPDGDQFKGATPRSRALAKLYAAEAATHGLDFFDAAEGATASEIDGLHLDAAENIRLGNYLAPLIRDAVIRASRP